MEVLVILILAGVLIWTLTSMRNAGHPEDPTRPCGICNRPSHEAWLKRGIHVCGRRRCLVQTHVRSTGMQIPEAAVFLNQLTKLGALTFYRGRCIPTITWDVVNDVDPLFQLESTETPSPPSPVAREPAPTTASEPIDYQKSMRRILAQRQIRLEGPENEERSFREVVTLAAWIGEQAVSRSGAQLSSLDNDDRFVAMLFAFVASDHLSRLAQVSFEETSVLACLDLNASLRGGLVSESIGQLIATHTAMATNPKQAETLQAIGGQVASFFETNADKHLTALGRLFSIVRGGLRHASRGVLA